MNTLESTTDVLGGCSVQRLVGRHCVATLILGDSETMELPPADALVSDPPYGIGYVHSGKCRVNHGMNGGKPKQPMRKHVMGDNKPFDPSRWLTYPTVILWGANHYASKLPDKACWLAWDKHLKDHGTSFSEWEAAWTNLPAKRARIFRHYWHGALRAGEANAKPHLHPMQKPVELMAWCMDVAKLPEGCTVLDPYMGSGSTGVACIKTGRNFVGIERDAEYYKLACDRIAHELDGALL